MDSPSGLPKVVHAKFKTEAFISFVIKYLEKGWWNVIND